MEGSQHLAPHRRAWGAPFLSALDPEQQGVAGHGRLKIVHHSVSDHGTVRARNALREADALVFLVLRYRAAHRPACREARAPGP
jgi:hypothetical protein